MSNHRLTEFWGLFAVLPQDGDNIKKIPSRPEVKSVSNDEKF